MLRDHFKHLVISLVIPFTRNQLLVLIPSHDPSIYKPHADLRIRIHDALPFDNRRVRTPQPLHRLRHKPPILLVPGKDHPASAPESAPSRSRVSPRGASGDVAGSTRGSWTGANPSGEVCVRHEVVDPASGEGLLIVWSTDGIAAWWGIPSAPGKESHLTVLPLRPLARCVSIRRSRSVMLPSMNVTRG